MDIFLELVPKIVRPRNEAEEGGKKFTVKWKKRKLFRLVSGTPKSISFVCLSRLNYLRWTGMRRLKNNVLVSPPLQKKKKSCVEALTQSDWCPFKKRLGVSICLGLVPEGNHSREKEQSCYFPWGWKPLSWPPCVAVVCSHGRWGRQHVGLFLSCSSGSCTLRVVTRHFLSAWMLFLKAHILNP